MARVRLSSRFHVRAAWLMVAALALAMAGCVAAEQAADPPVSEAPPSTMPAAAPSASLRAPASALAPSPAATFDVGTLAIDESPGTIRPGDVVTVSATVRNTGSVAGVFDAVLTVNGSLVGRRAVDLGAGESAVVRIPVQIRAGGAYNVRLGDQQLALFVAAPAVISLGGLEVSENPVDSGARVTVRVTVANTGGETGAQVVQLRIDGKVVATKRTTVAGGGRQTVEFSIRAPAAGWHTVAAGELETRLLVWKIARQPNGTLLVNKLRGGYGKLTVKNRGELDAVLMFAKPSAPKKALLAVYVRGGKSATVTGIKDGTYVVLYAMGTRWDTHGKVFTSSAERRRFDDTVRFRTTRTSTQIRFVTWTLTLQARSGGNAPTTWVDEDDFPGVP
jgi:hypothetical protein